MSQFFCVSIFLEQVLFGALPVMPSHGPKIQLFCRELLNVLRNNIFFTQLKNLAQNRNNGQKWKGIKVCHASQWENQRWHLEITPFWVPQLLNLFNIAFRIYIQLSNLLTHLAGRISFKTSHRLSKSDQQLQNNYRNTIQIWQKFLHKITGHQIFKLSVGVVRHC